MDDCFGSTWAYSHGPLVDPVSRLHHQHTSTTSSSTTPHPLQHHQHQLHEQQQQLSSNESILDAHEHSQLIGYTNTNSSSASSISTNQSPHHQYQHSQQHYDDSNNVLLPLQMSPAAQVHNISHNTISYGESYTSNASHIVGSRSDNQQQNHQHQQHQLNNQQPGNSLHETCTSLLESYVSSINTQPVQRNNGYGATGNGINYDCRSATVSQVVGVFHPDNLTEVDGLEEKVEIVHHGLVDEDRLEFPSFFPHLQEQLTNGGAGDVVSTEGDLDELEQGDLTDLSGNFDGNHPSVSTTDYLIDEDYEEEVDDDENAEDIEDIELEGDDTTSSGIIAKDLLQFKGKPNRDFNLDTNGTKKQGELKCKFCGFVCCSKSSLGIHERRHTGEKPYSCKYCGRLFNSAQCCKHHERLHTGDKPFECAYCGKKYAVSTRLKRHERVHTREEPYKCQECGKTFRWFDAFRDHRNTHNGVPLYLCSVCGKSFTSYLKFYYHERGHFQKKEKERNVRALLDADVSINLGKKGNKATAASKKVLTKKTPKTG